MRKKVRFQWRAGFSLIEMMIVISIMATLMTLVGRSVMKNLEKSKVQTTKMRINQVCQELTIYYADHDRYPSVEEYTQLIDLKMRQDGWGREFIYTLNEDGFEVKSLGKSGKEGGEVISSKES